MKSVHSHYHHSLPVPLLLLVLLLTAIAVPAQAVWCPAWCGRKWRQCPAGCATRVCKIRERKWVQTCKPNGVCEWKQLDVYVNGWHCQEKTCRKWCAATWPHCDAPGCYRLKCGVVNGQQRWRCEFGNGCTKYKPVCPGGATVLKCAGTATGTATYRCGHVQAIAPPTTSPPLVGQPPATTTKLPGSTTPTVTTKATTKPWTTKPWTTKKPPTQPWTTKKPPVVVTQGTQKPKLTKEERQRQKEERRKQRERKRKEREAQRKKQQQQQQQQQPKPAPPQPKPAPPQQQPAPKPKPVAAPALAVPKANPQ